MNNGPKALHLIVVGLMFGLNNPIWDRLNLPNFEPNA